MLATFQVLSNCIGQYRYRVETVALNDILDHMNLTDTYTEYPIPKHHNTYSSVHGTFSRIEHMLATE